MVKKLDLNGQVFGRLTVIKEVEPYISPKGSRHSKWLCKCECGDITEVVGSNLKSGNTKSCGCSQKITEGDAVRNSKYNYLYEKHKSMLDRCSNPNNKDYAGRGIEVEDYFLGYRGYINFKEYILSNLGERPDKTYSLDRIDNSKGYERGNLRWATSTIQNINRRIQCRNTSGHKGVIWCKFYKRWVARISVNKKVIYLGKFEDINDAITARMKAEKLYHLPLVQ